MAFSWLVLLLSLSLSPLHASCSTSQKKSTQKLWTKWNNVHDDNKKKNEQQQQKLIHWNKISKIRNNTMNGIYYIVSFGKHPIKITIQQPKTKPNEYCQLKIYLLRLGIALFLSFSFSILFTSFCFRFTISLLLLLFDAHFYPLPGNS